jgi:hypothetical protein
MVLRAVFERFTEQARQIVVLAQEESRAPEDATARPEHLLVGLLPNEACERLRAGVEMWVWPSLGDATVGLRACPELLRL